MSFVQVSCLVVWEDLCKQELAVRPNLIDTSRYNLRGIPKIELKITKESKSMTDAGETPELKIIESNGCCTKKPPAVPS